MNKEKLRIKQTAFEGNRQNLLNYCGLDTEETVWMVDKLNLLVRDK